MSETPIGGTLYDKTRIHNALITLRPLQRVGTKAELELVRTRLADATSRAENYLEELSVTENKLERLKSETVQRLEMKPRAQPPVKEEQASKPNGHHSMKSEINDPNLAVCLCLLLDFTRADSRKVAAIKWTTLLYP